MAKEKGRKLVAQNRKARHDYHIHETYEAGVVLGGTEVKSLREGRAQLTDAFATVDDGEVWLRNAHIPEYTHGTWTNHTARRTRKLLLNRKEITRIERELSDAGTTLDPAGDLLLRRLRQGGDRRRHRQAGVRQASDPRHPGVPARGRTGACRPQPRSLTGDPTPAAAGPLPSLATVLATLGLTVATALPAYAADDQIDSFVIDYAVQPSGVVKVRETITYRFGSSSGRHGIERYFIVREPYDDTNDAVYTPHQHQDQQPGPLRAPPSGTAPTAKPRTAARSRLGCGSVTRTGPSPRPRRPT